MTRTFLWLHGLGWTAFCVSAYLNALPTLAPGQHGPMLAAKSLRTAIGCVLSALLYVGIQRLRNTNPPLPLLLAVVIVSAGLLGPVWLSLYWLVSAPIRGDLLPLTDWTRFPSAVLDYSFILLAWSLAGLGVQEWAAPPRSGGWPPRPGPPPTGVRGWPGSGARSGPCAAGRGRPPRRSDG